MNLPRALASFGFNSFDFGHLEFESFDLPSFLSVERLFGVSCLFTGFDFESLLRLFGFLVFISSINISAKIRHLLM